MVILKQWEQKFEKFVSKEKHFKTLRFQGPAKGKSDQKQPPTQV
jgi:hypothetical protein